MFVCRSQLVSRLHLHPGDTAVLFGYAERRQRDRIVVEAVFGVVHRKREAFTHVYRMPCHAAAGRTEVYLEKVICGERLREARHWASTVFALNAPATYGSRISDTENLCKHAVRSDVPEILGNVDRPGLHFSTISWANLNDLVGEISASADV